MDGDAEINEMEVDSNIEMNEIEVDSDVTDAIEKYSTEDEFILVSKSPAYVDKTLLIQTIWNSGKQLLFTAPRRFNKTSNLRMIQAFFDIDQSTKEERDLAFSNKLISGTEVKNEFGKYPIIFANFSIGGEVDSLLKAKNCCRKIMYDAFSRHDYLLESEKLKKSNGRPLPGVSLMALERWLDQDLPQPDEDMIQDSLRLLAKCLRLHHGVPPILLIDEFDNICIKALYKCKEDELNGIIFFYGDMVGNLLKTHKKEYTKAVLTGITSVTCRGLTTLSNLLRYRFLDSEKFAPFYGITMEEFEDVLRRIQSPRLISKKKEALSFYNGYKFTMEDETTLQILNTYSVVNFLARKEVRPYWDGSGLVAGLEETIGSEDVIKMTHDLLNDEIVWEAEVKSDKPFSPSQLANFNAVAQNPAVKFQDLNFLCYFLHQQGYISIEKRKDEMVGFKIPNEETRKAFREILQSYYIKKCSFKHDTIKDCRKLLIALSRSEDKVKEQMNQLNTCFNEFFVAAAEHKNEAMFERILFFIFFNVRDFFEMNSQRKVGLQEKVQERNVYDLVLHARDENNADFLFELKVDHTASAALNQIVEKQYYLACKSKRYYLICINLKNKSGKNSITMEYLVNEINLTNRTKCEIAAP